MQPTLEQTIRTLNMGIDERQRGDHPQMDSQAAEMLLSTALRPIIEDFLQTLQYSTPPKRDDEQLKSAMLSFAESSGVPYKDDKHAHQCFVTGLSVASVSIVSHILTSFPHGGSLDHYQDT